MFSGKLNLSVFWEQFCPRQWNFNQSYFQSMFTCFVVVCLKYLCIYFSQLKNKKPWMYYVNKNMLFIIIGYNRCVSVKISWKIGYKVARGNLEKYKVARGNPKLNSQKYLWALKTILAIAIIIQKQLIHILQSFYCTYNKING